MAMVLSLLCTFGAFAQNYSTVPVALQNGVLVVNGVNQLSVPNYDPSEVSIFTRLSSFKSGLSA